MTGPRLAYVVATTAGGTGRHVAMLAAGCAARNLDVRVFGPPAAAGLFGGVTFAPVDIGSRPHPARDAAAVLELRRLLARGRPDLVHAHGLRAGAATAAALAGAASRRPGLLVTVHNQAPPGALSHALYLALERLTARRADAVLCVSPDLVARLRRAGAHDVALATIAAPPAAGPSAHAIAAAQGQLGDAGRPVVFAAGRVARQKGFDVLIDAAILLRHRDPPPVLAIAGDGPLAGPLAARSRAGGAGVRFLGARDDVPALLAAADVVVVPSRWEGQPLIVQEALRAGRPLIASRAGGIPRLTGEDGALLVAPGDPGSLAAAVASVLDDPGRALALAEAAKARAATLPSDRDAVDAAVAAYARLTRPGMPGRRSRLR